MKHLDLMNIGDWLRTRIINLWDSNVRFLWDSNL